MSALYRAYEIALVLSAITGFGLCVILWTKARQAPGAKPLIGFVAGAAVGTLGWVSLAIFGFAASLPAHLAIATAPLACACFVHFAFAFTRGDERLLPSWLVPLSYAIGLGVTVGAWLRGVGTIKPWLDFPAYYFLDWYGWIIVGTTTSFAVLGHLRMFLAWWRARPIRRRQLVASCIAALWGFTASVGFLFPNFGIDLFPVPALLHPLFIVILVYGVLRYQIMETNLWARRTLTWLLLMLSSGLVLAILAAAVAASGIAGEAVSFWRAWLYGSAGVLLAALLLAPLGRLADRLVFPGGQIAERDLAQWREALGKAGDWHALAATAEALLRDRLRGDIAVILPDRMHATIDPTTPALVCSRADGKWHCAMKGWEDAPPGPRYVGQMMAAVLEDAAARLEAAELAAEREGERLRQAHLAELGALAATVAHDLRNPLNIIAMAAAGSDKETRGEIATQLSRMNHLISDLLDYSSAWKAEPRAINLRDEIDGAVQGIAGAPIDVAADGATTIDADPRAVRRVFVNLLANARAAAGPGGKIRVEARSVPGQVQIDVLDNGSGIPAEIRDRLFQPFVSRSAGGTGLGLAIAARIMQAHRGSIAVEQRSGWATCFTLRFPA
jgi:signal transduction histidine kinase